MGLLLFLFFSILAVILVACAIGFTVLERQRKQQVTSMLRTVSGTEEGPANPVILINRPDQQNFFDRLVARLDITHRLQSEILQAGLDWDVAHLALGMTIFAVLGFFLGLKFNLLIFPWLSAAALGCFLGALPYIYVRFKRKQRLREFEEQFPEALDFLARSMRAGHAFSVSLEMLGEESPDPLGREFRTLFNEQNLGANIETALAGLARRIPLLDVRFFVSSVMLQRQTGGNLSEILMRLSFIIRERFKLRGQVRAASAHGRITAAILTVMPIVLAMALTIVAPSYLSTMAHDPDGKYLILAAFTAQLLGFYFIRRIINIKV